MPDFLGRPFRLCDPRWVRVYLDQTLGICSRRKKKFCVHQSSKDSQRHYRPTNLTANSREVIRQKVIETRNHTSQGRNIRSKKRGTLVPGGKSGISRLRTISCRTLRQASWPAGTLTGNLVFSWLNNGRYGLARISTTVSRYQKAGVTNSWRETRSSWKSRRPF